MANPVDLSSLIQQASGALAAPVTPDNVVPRVNQLNQSRGNLFNATLQAQQAEELHRADISAMTREMQQSVLDKILAERAELEAETAVVSDQIASGYQGIAEIAEQRKQVAESMQSGGFLGRVSGLFKDAKLATQQEALAQSTRQLVNIKTQKIIESAQELEQYRITEYMQKSLAIKQKQEEFARVWKPETAQKALELYNVQAGHVYDSVKFVADNEYRQEQVKSWKAQQEKITQAEVSSDILVNSYLELAGIESTAQSRTIAQQNLANLEGADKKKYAQVLALMEARQRAKNLGKAEFLATTTIAPSGIMETALEISGQNVEAFRAAKVLVAEKLTGAERARLDAESFDVQGNLKIPAPVYANRAKEIQDSAEATISAMPGVEVINVAHANLDLALDARVTAAPTNPAIWGQIMEVAHAETSHPDVKKLFEKLQPYKEAFQQIWVQPVTDTGGALENGAYAFYKELQKYTNTTTALLATQDVLKTYARTKLPAHEGALAAFLEQYTHKKITPDLLVHVKEGKGFRFWQPDKIKPFNLFDPVEGYKYFLEREKEERGIF